MTTPESAATGPLAGIRIIDLSSVFSGPMATALLADQGAEVIKIESHEGDISRRVGPAKGDLSATFIVTNRGKRSISIDLKSPAALPILQALLRSADAVVNNFRPGVMERLGLPDALLVQLNPRLVRLSITGFGPTGPRADDRAYDAVIQAVSGMSASHRDKHSGQPGLLSTTVCDKLTALTAAQALTAALFARERDGQGRLVEVAMLDAAVAFQWVDAMYNQVFLDDAPAPFPEIGLTLKPYATADGFVASMGPQQSEFKGLCEALNHPEIALDPRFLTQQARGRHPRELRAVLEPLFAGFSTDELEIAARAQGAPLGRVNEHAQVLSDPQVLHNHLLTNLDHGEIGRVRLARAAAVFDGVATAPLAPAPHLGQHGRALLSEFGFDEAQVAQWIASGVLRVPAGRST